jgi:hypothetical protein
MSFHKPKPLGFRKWISLEDHKKLIAEAVEGSEFPERVFDYLSTAFGDKGWRKKSWKTPVYSLADGFQKFNPDPSLPLLNAPKEKKEADWEYKGRSWNYFSHLLANAYGWTLEYIAEMDVNEALGHVQEILTQEYLEQEFTHSLSEVSYVYNKNTKKSDYKPLPRPYWMRPVSQPTKKVRIRRDMLPVGYVVDASGLGAELGGWNEIITKNESTRNTQAVPPPS